MQKKSTSPKFLVFSDVKEDLSNGVLKVFKIGMYNYKNG